MKTDFVRSTWRGLFLLGVGILLQLVNLQSAQVDVVIFAGQSNMTGASADYTTAGIAQAGDAALAEYYYDTQGGSTLVERHDSGGQFTTLQGVKMQIVVGDPVLTDRFGPEIGFARKIKELDSSFNLAVVKISFGNSLLVDWLKGATLDWGDAYNQRLVAGVNSALSVISNRGDTPVIQGMVWAQGETDAADFNNHANFYGTRLGQFLTDFRADINVPNMPFMAIELGSNLAAGEAFRSAFLDKQNDYLVTDANAVLVSTSGLTYDPSDRTHWLASEMIEIGERSAQSFHDNFVAVPEPINAVLVGLGLLGWGVIRKKRGV